jgi:hypothetical protein
LKNPDPKTEVDRVFVKGGIVIRHFYNLDCEILCANGDYAYFKRDELTWRVTNDKGFRREVRNGVERDLPKINSLI